MTAGGSRGEVRRENKIKQVYPMFPAQTFQHRTGSQGHVTFKIAPYTNLRWRDYEFSGTIIKLPDSIVYDSAEVSLPFYCDNNSSSYTVQFKMDGIHLKGPNIDSVKSFTFNHGDTVRYQISARTLPKNNLPDKITDIEVNIKKNNNSWERKFAYSDESDQRIQSGLPAVRVDLSQIANYSERNLVPFKFKDISVQKKN